MEIFDNEDRVIKYVIKCLPDVVDTAIVSHVADFTIKFFGITQHLPTKQNIRTVYKRFMRIKSKVERGYYIGVKNKDKPMFYNGEVIMLRDEATPKQSPEPIFNGRKDLSQQE